MPATPPSIESAASSGDRLSFAIFIATALHGMMVFGLGFNYIANPEAPTTFEVTLATHKNQQAPEEADYQAQFNQEASGTEDDARELTTDKPALFADTQINDAQALPETMAREASEARELNRVHTNADSAFKVSDRDNPEEVETREEREGNDKEVPVLNTEIASLRAKLARQQQAYAKRPRIQRLTSLATVASAEAEYLNDWRRKVEVVGNKNFPPEALEKRIFGQLRLATRIKADGTIVSVDILQSSGHSILDNAALQIVHRAAPYAPFPSEIRKDYDQLEIIRTWRFDITGLSTAAAAE